MPTMVRNSPFWTVTLCASNCRGTGRFAGSQNYVSIIHDVWRIVSLKGGQWAASCALSWERQAQTRRGLTLEQACAGRSAAIPRRGQSMVGSTTEIQTEIIARSLGAS
jgi:hypothetical protein